MIYTALDVIDVDDTRRCPTDRTCATCGVDDRTAARSADGLAVATLATPVGVCCTTLCGACAADGRLPRIHGWSAAARAVLDHCEHLDCDLDDMAAALDVERRAGGAR